MDYVRAFDGSNWTTGTGPNGDLTSDDVSRLVNAGIQLGIIQALVPPPGYPRAGDSQFSARMGRAVVDGGATLDAYLYWIEGGAPFPNKIALMEGLPVRAWLVDLEEKPVMPAWSLNSSVKLALMNADAAPSTDGGPARVYTAWWWVQWFLQNGGDIALLKDRPLWWVWDDGKADPTLDRIPADKRPSAFGLDDSQLVMIQYALSTSAVGVSGIDLSVLTASEGESIMANVPQVPQDYRDKFALSGPYDWPGVVTNLEGIITQLQGEVQQASATPTSDADAQAIAAISDILRQHGYTVTK